MTALVETSTWESTITQLETTDLVLGGSEGPSNRALKQLANRTKYLYDLIRYVTELPFAALPYPTISTADRKLVVNAAAASSGGTVSVPSGQRLTLSTQLEAGLTGRPRQFVTELYTSADLTANVTYYLRAKVTSGGELEIYVQRGTDADAIPAGFVGTPNALSGGGFDSTVFDMLVAKVVTGAGGSVPTVTKLANASRLFLREEMYLSSVAHALSWASLSAAAKTLDWARTPHAMITLLGHAAYANMPDGSDPTEYPTMVMVRSAGITRYGLAAEYVYDDTGNNFGALRVAWDAVA